MLYSVTMFADASVSSKTKCSGWGFWIIGDGRDSMYAGGPLKGFSKNTSVAELEAIANGISCASAAQYFRVGDRSILIQCDNIEALGCLIAARSSIEHDAHEESAAVNKRKRRMCDRQKAAVDHILKIADQHRLSITVRHIRGHTDGSGRNWVNQLCDSLAKKGRRKAEKAPAL